MFRAIVVDDEPLARARIRKLLQEHHDIEIVAEGRNGAEAVDVIRRSLAPDVRARLTPLQVSPKRLDGRKR